MPYSYEQQINHRMMEYTDFGTSRQKRKEDHNAQKVISSYGTYKVYKQQMLRFAEFCGDEHDAHNVMKMERYVKGYLEHLIDDYHKGGDMSPSSIKTAACALGKFYGKSYLNEMETPSRHIADVFKGRGVSERAKEFSEKRNADVMDFLRGTGLRRNELTHLHGNSVIQRPDGNYYLHVTEGTKGGRERYARIRGDVEKIVEKIQSTPEDRLVYGNGNKHQYSHLNIHALRREYAQNLYQEIFTERNIDITALPYCDVYHCRGDFVGDDYVKAIMDEVAESLGHSRQDVLMNYLH